MALLLRNTKNGLYNMKTLLSIIASAILLAAASLPAQAQIQEVKQTVFGMDCAPCAHALEKRLGGIDGVTDVKVSLNEGLAELTLQSDNEVTLTAIREAVKASGFAAKAATIRAAGTIKRESGRLVLFSNTGERFELQAREGADVDFGRLTGSAGKRVEITGRVSEGTTASDGLWRLAVTGARI